MSLTSSRVHILQLCIQPHMTTKHECHEDGGDTQTYLKVQEVVAEDSYLQKLIQDHMYDESLVSAEALTTTSQFLASQQLWF